MYFSPDEVSSFNAETSYWSPGPKRSNFSHLVPASCFHFSKAYLKIHSVESIFYSIKLQQNINLNYPKKVPAKVFQQNFLENGSMSLEIIKDSTKKKKKKKREITITFLKQQDYTRKYSYYKLKFQNLQNPAQEFI